MDLEQLKQTILEQIDRSHMPTSGLTVTKKCWRDGFNKGKDNVIEQVEEILSQLGKEDM